MLFGMAQISFAEQRGVFMEFHRKCNPEKNTEVNRAPIRLPIEVLYDSETHKIEVIGDESLEAEVFLYKSNGTIENYSCTLNTEFIVFVPDLYIIQIFGECWYAEGEIQI